MKEPNGFWIILCRHGKARMWMVSLHCSKRMPPSPCLPHLPGMRVQSQLAYLPPQQSLQMAECSTARQSDDGVSHGQTQMPRQPLPFISAQRRISIKPSECMCWKSRQADWQKLSVLLTLHYRPASDSL